MLRKFFILHLRMTGDHDEIYFRDYLCQHSDIAQAYQELKLSLWKKFEHNRDAYTDAKTDFINHYVSEAKSSNFKNQKVHQKSLIGERIEKSFYTWLMTERNPKSNSPKAILADLALKSHPSQNTQMI